MKFDLPPLPYKVDALEPHLSRKAIDLHYNKHTKGYLKKLNSLPEVANLDEKISLEQLILQSRKERRRPLGHVLPPRTQPTAVFNNAAQLYNHTFFFRSLKPDGGGAPAGDIGEIITAQYGSWDSFRKRIKARGKGVFGSGWVWIVLDENNDLQIVQGLNAETPFVYGMLPLLAIDVWEHSYYPDYENDRSKYLEAVVDNLLNWDFANENMGHEQP